MTNNGHSRTDGPILIEDFLKTSYTMPRELIGRGILYAGSKAVIYGRYKRFKSMFVLWMLSRIRDGKDVLGLPVDPVGVSGLYLQSEIAEPLLWRRATSMWTGAANELAAQLANLPLGAPSPVPAIPNTQQLYIWTMPSLKLDQPEGAALLEKHVYDLGVDLVVIDPLYKFLSGDITSPAAVTPFQDHLDRIIANTGAAILVVAHPRKPGQQDEANTEDTDDLLGSSTWSNWPDAVMKIVRPKNAPQDTFVLRMDVLRHAEEPVEEIAYTIDRKSLQFKRTVIV